MEQHPHPPQKADCVGLLLLGVCCAASHQGKIPPLELGPGICERRWLFSKYTWIWTSKEPAVLSSYPAQSPFGRLHHWVLGFSLLSSTFRTVQSQSDGRSSQSLSESVLMMRRRARANYLVNSFLSFITLFPMFRNRDQLLAWNTMWLFFYTEITW